MAGKILMMVFGCAILFDASALHADWQDTLKSVTAAGKPAKATSALSNKDMVGGLKEALAVGTEHAIKGLGRSGGYLNDASVRIALPEKLKGMDSTLRMLGQGAKVDEFTQTMNHAAERAIPEAAPIVADAIRAMTIADAEKILRGPDDSATRYFREKTTDSLTARLMPIVQRATNTTGVTKAYKNMLGAAGPASAMLGNDFDVDHYVTRKALDGLFLKVAAQEKAIRTNPMARSSDLLKKVFGSVAH